MKCESSHCLANEDYRNTFDITEDGATLTIYLKKIIEHTHSMKFIFNNEVFIMGVKDNILQIWKDDSK